VPSSLIHNHQYEFIGVTHGYLFKKDRHRFCVDFWEYQGVHHSIMKTNRHIGRKCILSQSEQERLDGCPEEPNNDVIRLSGRIASRLETLTKPLCLLERAVQPLYFLFLEVSLPI
jgi:hypothetical protein